VKSALSVAFGLADLKARRAGIQLGMMFVDEPSFLDQEGTDAYCDALELLGQKYPNMKIIAISHDIRMISRFPQIIRVEDTGETGSKVRLVA
jgi:exonuclease SbcC